VLICLLAAVLAATSVKMVRIARPLVSARRHLLAIQSLADLAQAGQWGREDLEALQQEVAATRADLGVLRSEVEPLLPLCPYLGWLPRLGGEVQSAPHLLRFALSISGATEAALEGLAPALYVMDRDPSTEELLDEGTGILTAAQPQLLIALRELRRASEARAEIDEGRLSPDLARLLTRLDGYLPLAQSGVQGALLAPELLGASQTKHYLILAQNEDELRATGGFISGVGLARVHRGQILDLSFRDSYAFGTKAEEDPPQALEKYMGAQIWLLRDANWSPDFPTAARVAADIYERDQRVSLDGVIAVDQQAIRLLLEALGPVEVKEWEQPVTATNFIPAIREAWGSRDDNPGQWWRHRKDFMGTIAQALVQKLETAPDSISPLKLARAMERALEEKHILVYMEQPQALQILTETHWNGAILHTEGDYLMVVDTNVGFNKVDPNVEEALRYHVSVRSDGTVQSDLTLKYRNVGTRNVSQCIQEARYDSTYEQMTNRCYWDYLRVYVPAGVRLVEGTRNPLPAGSLFRRMSGEGTGTGEPTLEPREKGKDVLGTFFVVAPGGSHEVQFTYELPRKVLTLRGGQRQYSLVIQKQPGTSARPLQLRIELPPSSRMLAADPEPGYAERGVVEYDLLLSTTERVEIVFD